MRADLKSSRSTIPRLFTAQIDNYLFKPYCHTLEYTTPRAFWQHSSRGTVLARMTEQRCTICRERLSAGAGFSISRGNILPTFRLCGRCGNSLEAVMQKLETLAAVQRNLGLDRVIVA